MERADILKQFRKNLQDLSNHKDLRSNGIEIVSKMKGNTFMKKIKNCNSVVEIDIKSKSLRNSVTFDVTLPNGYPKRNLTFMVMKQKGFDDDHV